MRKRKKCGSFRTQSNGNESIMSKYFVLLRPSKEAPLVIGEDARASEEKGGSREIHKERSLRKRYK